VQKFLDPNAPRLLSLKVSLTLLIVASRQIRECCPASIRRRTPGHSVRQLEFCERAPPTVRAHIHGDSKLLLPSGRPVDGGTDLGHRLVTAESVVADHVQPACGPGTSPAAGPPRPRRPPTGNGRVHQTPRLARRCGDTRRKSSLSYRDIPERRRGSGHDNDLVSTVSYRPVRTRRASRASSGIPGPGPGVGARNTLGCDPGSTMSRDEMKESPP
jgi:hypothetical protein